MDTDQQRQGQQQQSNPLRLPKGSEVELQEDEMLHLAAAAATAAQLMPSLYFAKGKEMGEISEKINGLSKENTQLREKLKAYKKDNTEMNQKIGSLQNCNQKQEETIRSLELSQEKLQNELESVKEAKERLRIEIEENTSKFSEENTILTKKLEDLTKEFEAVENENRELKRSLEQLKDSNNSLKQTVDSIRDENKQLKDEFKSLKAEHQKICEKLECKETRLALGQVAWLLEAEIWKAVLPNQKMGKTGILRSMEKWLRKNSSNLEGKAAQKRWDDLKEKLNWNEDDHPYGLQQLKDLRKEDAHPEGVDLEEARHQLKEGDYLADTDKEVCEQIINMVIEAKKLNSSAK